MKKLIKCLINIFTKKSISFLGKFNSGRYFTDQISKNILNKKKIVKHKNQEFSFYVPNRINYFRADTFSTKEPETLDWIDTFKKNSIFWDIGANVGLYSCYAAKSAGCKVYAFEPSIFNLELLSKNIFLNSVSDKIVIIPFPVSERLDFNTFFMSSTDWGGALSTFGKNVGHDGNPISNVFKYKTVGMSMDNCVNTLSFEKPNYIKIDVDGIEHLILKGGTKTLESVESILVEINDNFKQQSDDTNKYLTNAGFNLSEKRYSSLDGGPENLRGHHNQIWIK